MTSHCTQILPKNVITRGVLPHHRPQDELS
jgi:hypothetical protein